MSKHSEELVDRIQDLISRIAENRDDIRELLSDISNLADNHDEAISYLERAVDILSERE